MSVRVKPRRELTEPEALVYAAAFAHAVAANAPCPESQAQKTVQRLREVSAGAPKSRDTVGRMLADFRMQDSHDGAE